MDLGHPATTLVLALGAGVLAHLVARHIRISAIVVLLGIGAGLGPDGLGWVQPRALGEGLFAIVELAVAIILFEGGLNLEISRLRRSQRPIRRLVTLGAVVTLAGGALFARWLLDWSWLQCWLFGSLIVVTGPTVIGPLVSELRLHPRVATVLEAEGVLIDPIGALFAVLMLELSLSPGQDPLASGALGLLFRLGFGAAFGLLTGLLLAWLLRIRHVVPEGFENIFTLAAVLGIFQGCNELVSQSGILAVAIAGVVVGNVRTRVDRDLREFKDQLSLLMIGLLFVLLAADVRFAEVRALGWAGLALVGALIVIVRPLNVWLSTAGSELAVRERLLVAWIAPRGIVAAALASLTAAGLEAEGLPGGAEIRALVFLTILGTVLLAGLTARPVSTLLGVRLPRRETVAIVGAQGLGLALGSELQKGGVPVVFLDSNPQNCRRAEEAEFSVVFGNALEERTLTRARFGEVGTAIGLTSNETLNGLFVSRARELFSVPRAHIAITSGNSGVTPEIAESQAATTLFESPHDLERWDVRFRHGDVVIEPFELRETESEHAPSGHASPEAPVPDELSVILCVQRGEGVLPMSADLTPRVGDVASIAVYVPEREEALQALAKRGWQLQTVPPGQDS
jgi:NhaP-type Na+/H+ or K+/H+ antiporter